MRAGAQGGAPVLGLPPDMDLPALRGAVAGEQEAGVARDAGASPLGPAQPEAQGEAATDGEQTQRHQAQWMVGYRHDQALGGGLWVGLYRGGAGLVYAKDCRLLRW